MTSRNSSSYIIDKFKENGYTTIIPNSSVRFVMGFISELPDLQGLDREKLVKRIRLACELGVTVGKLKRKRDQSTPGYVYHIL